MILKVRGFLNEKEEFEIFFFFFASDKAIELEWTLCKNSVRWVGKFHK